MCSISKFCCVGRNSGPRTADPNKRKLKNFITVRIELSEDLNYIRRLLKEYPCVDYSFFLLLTIDILQLLEMLVLLFAVFHFAAFAVNREQCRRRFQRL